MHTLAPATGPLPRVDRASVSSHHSPTKPAYRPEIDGLRAFAVVPVILFHLGVPGFASGSLGVDVFFVISGFLITAIVRREADAGDFSFARFWARRVRRILPAMLAVSAASLLATLLLVYRPDQQAIGRQATWALLSGANLYFWKFVGNYWGWAAGQSPFLHTWSLAVEEQFYLFMPAAVWLVYRTTGRRGLLPCAIGAVVVSLTLFLLLVSRKPDAAFYLLPARAWELAAGCVLALLPVRSGGGLRNSLGLLGLGTIVAAYIFATSFGVSAVAVVVGATLVLAFGGAGFCRHLLANSPTVFVGRLSYSLYLWHWPVIVFPLLLGRDVPLWASLPTMSGLALLSYFFIERPTRHARHTVPLSLAGLAVLTLAAGWMAGTRRAYDTSGFATPTLSIRAYDCNPTAPAIDDTWVGMDVRPALAGPRDFVDGGIRTGDGAPQVVVLGDSHATFWAPAVRRATDRLDVPASFWMMSGVDPFFTASPTTRMATTIPWFVATEDLLAYDRARIAKLAEWRPRVVVVAARWSVKSRGGVVPCLDYLCRTAEQVLLIEQPPELPIGNRNAVQYLCYEGVVPQDGVTAYHAAENAEAVERGRALLRDLAALYPNCRVVPTFDLYAADKGVRVLDGRQALYMDDDHLTDYGASLADERIARAITEAIGER